MATVKDIIFWIASGFACIAIYLIVHKATGIDIKFSMGYVWGLSWAAYRTKKTVKEIKEKINNIKSKL